MQRIEAARRFARLAHNRKVSGLPYIVHPLGVAAILAGCGAPADLVVAGLLHDTVEDSVASLAEIERLFGRAIARLVACVTGDSEGPWKERRERSPKRLEGASVDCLFLKCADALDNMRSTRRDLERYGEAVWPRLRPKAELAWYYRRLARLFIARLRGASRAQLAAELHAEVERVFG
jgi:(p)ppGpp synthase/HD superfamily hydrolase